MVAVTGLGAGRLDGVIAALQDVPFLQDFPRGIDITARGPYPEISAFLGRHRDRYEPMVAVLNYFDGVNLARGRHGSGTVFGSADGRYLPVVHRVRQGIIYRYRCGIAWRDVPAECGPWQTI